MITQETVRSPVVVQSAPPKPGLLRPRPAPKLRHRLVLLAATLLGIVLVLELGFRTHDWLVLDLPFFWDPALASKKKTQLGNSFLLFRGRYEDYRTRAKTPEQVIEPNGRQVLRIACLGGSTTQDMTAFVEAGITYPTELQRILNERLGPSSDVVVETLNAGFAAHSTLHMLILLETEILQTKPDVVIIYENINDLLVNYFPGVDAPMYANKFLHPFYLPPEMTVEKTTLLDHSRLYTWSRDRLRTVAGNELRYSDEPFELRHAESFRTNLRNLCVIARAHGITVVLGQQAMAADTALFEKHFGSKSYNLDIRYPRIDELQRHFERYNAIIHEVAEKEGVPCVDVYSRLKDRPELFVDVIHLHAAGSRLVGQEFAGVLMESGQFRELVEAKRRLAAWKPATLESALPQVE